MPVVVQNSDDKKLVKQLLAGDEKAFNEFFEGYFSRLYRFALVRMEGHEQEIQDIVQTTMMKAINGLSGFRGEAALFTWVCQICRNEINGWFRSRQKEAALVPQEDETIRSILENLSELELEEPDSRLHQAQMQRLVQSVLDHLPMNYGDALEWKYIKGWSVIEIAEAMGTTHLAAQSTLSRARNAFRQAIEDMAGTQWMQNGGGVS